MANNNSSIMSLANQIRKEQHVSQKEAFAMAKAQLAATASANEAPVSDLYGQLEQKLKTGAVKFTYKNIKGKEITTRGTMDEARIAKRIAGDKRTTIPGAKSAKSADTAVFFDLSHGCYRPVVKANIVKVW